MTAPAIHRRRRAAALSTTSTLAVMACLRTTTPMALDRIFRAAWLHIAIEPQQRPS